VPSTARLISCRGPEVLGLCVAVGDRALDELAGETAGPFQQSHCVDGSDEWPTPYVYRFAAGRTGLEASGTASGLCSAQAEVTVLLVLNGRRHGKPAEGSEAADRAVTVARPAQRPGSSPQRPATRRAVRPTLAAIIS
jgi:hypothetical protein